MNVRRRRVHSTGASNIAPPKEKPAFLKTLELAHSLFGESFSESMALRTFQTSKDNKPKEARNASGFPKSLNETYDETQENSKKYYAQTGRKKKEHLNLTFYSREDMKLFDELCLRERKDPGFIGNPFIGRQGVSSIKISLSDKEKLTKHAYNQKILETKAKKGKKTFKWPALYRVEG